MSCFRFGMKMKASTFLFVLSFLGLSEHLTSAQYFTVQEGLLTATEGSCAELKCSVSSPVDDRNSDWFWMKDAKWNNGQFTDYTVIYSPPNSRRTISGDYAARVKYTGSLPSTWNSYSNLEQRCSIHICDLKKEDSGSYKFRYLGQKKWVTEEIKLKVTENQCPITLDKHPVIYESATLELSCSTKSSCPLRLQLLGVPTKEQSHLEDRRQKLKKTTATINVSWMDDERNISCQTENNQDLYLIQTINLTIEYAPKNTIATVTSMAVNEGQGLTFSCSARGRPHPTFQWFHNGLLVSTKAQWTIRSIIYSQAGSYICVAKNTYGSNRSQPLHINVYFKPRVEIQKIPSLDVLKEGDALLLSCHVKESNPPPHSYSWYKNGNKIFDAFSENKSIEKLKPDDGGSYTCEATNTAGTGESRPLQISVQYSPRNTAVSLSVDVNVKAGKPLTLLCVTDANPVPVKYSWYRYNDMKEADSEIWSAVNNTLTFRAIRRADEACYTCSATNAISTGEESKRQCIFVNYPPTNLQLFMDTEATEGDIIAINCTVESFPLSRLTLTRTPLLSSSSQLILQPPHNQQTNTLHYEVKATAAYAGLYTCQATNREGSQSTHKTLVVKYAPKKVTVQSESGLLVRENVTLTLRCEAQSHPEVLFFRWMKMINGKSKTIGYGQTITLSSVSPSDSGLYSCAATNKIGTGSSQQAEVNVKYAPKHTKVTMAAELQQDDGRSYVTLTCSARCYPPAKRFSWYKKAKDQEQDVKMSESETFTVFSDQPGIYYCTAKNEISERESEPVALFVGGDFIKFLLFLIILPVIALIFFAYRSRMNKSCKWNINSCFALLSDGSCTMRRMNQPVTADPSRSRDDLLPDQLGITEAQQCPPRPDSTPVSNFSCIYYQLEPHYAVMTPPAETPVKQTVDDSVNYAALQFGKKKKDKKAKEEVSVVYAAVSRKKSPEEEGGGLEDYENFSAVQAVRTPNPLNVDAAETSEDETEICYTQVHFTEEPGCQRSFGTCDGETTDYSEVQF